MMMAWHVKQRCSKCHIIKPTSDFYPDHGKIRRDCKTCHGTYVKAHLQSYIERDPILYRAQHMIRNINVRCRHKNMRVDYKYFNAENIAKRLLKQTHCLFCEFPFEYGYYEHRPIRSTPTFDRISNNRGYTKKNIQLICHSCNCRKGTGTNADLRKRLLKNPRFI